MGLFLKKDDSSFNKLNFNEGSAFDRPNQGFSNQPFIVKDIQEESTFLPSDKDFLVRGGTKLPGKIIDDEIRLTKYFVNTNNISGILFTAKQNLLSRISVDTDYNGINNVNQGIYTPLSTLQNIALSPIGSHSNLFINIFEYAKYNKENPEESQLLNINEKRLTGELSQTKVIKDYNGGPGSELGIGRTRIFATDNLTTDSNNPIIITDEQSEETRLRIDKSKTQDKQTLTDLYNIYYQFLNDYNQRNNINNTFESLISESINNEENITFNLLKEKSNYNTTKYNIPVINESLNKTKFKDLIISQLTSTEQGSFTFNNKQNNI